MRRRLVAGFVGVAVVLVVALALPLGILFSRYVRDKQTDQVEDRAQAIAVAFDRSASTGEAFEVRTSVEQETSILSPTGELITGTPVDEHSRALAEALIRSENRSATDRTDGEVVVAVLAGIDPEIRGVVVVTEATDPVEDTVHAGWLLLVALGAGVVGVAVLIARSLASWISQPLAQLQVASHSFGAEDLSARVDEAGWPPDLQDLGSTFNSMARRIEQLVASNEAFVHEASHQLRTPLTSLRLRLDALADDRADPSGDDLIAAREDVERLSRLTDELLALARAERPGPMPAEPLDLHEFLTSRVEQWGPLADEHGITFAVTDGVRSRVLADSDRLDQVLDNLFANAVDASAPGTTVSCSVRDLGDHVELSIIDQGRGMTEDERTRAFERFWSTAGSGNRAGLGGTGLGLPIVARLLDQDGATIRLEAGPGDVGTAAVIRFRPA